MPDITFPATQADAAVPVSATTRTSLFVAQSVPANLSVLNGQLTRANIDAAQLPLTHREVRRGAFGGGEMVGATANQDFFADWFEGSETPIIDIDDVGVGVAGGAMTYTLPYACTVVYLRWQMGVLTNGGHRWHPGTQDPQTDTKAAAAKLFVDGQPVDTYMQSFNRGRFTVPDRDAIKWNYYNDIHTPDMRWWSCEAAFYAADIHSAGLAVGIRKPYARGLHTAELRLAHDVDITRVKARCMVAVYSR